MAKNFRISLGAAGPVAGLPYDAKGNVVYTPQQVEQINREQHRLDMINLMEKQRTEGQQILIDTAYGGGLS